MTEAYVKPEAFGMITIDRRTRFGRVFFVVNDPNQLAGGKTHADLTAEEVISLRRLLKARGFRRGRLLG